MANITEYYVESFDTSKEAHQHPKFFQFYQNFQIIDIQSVGVSHTQETHHSNQSNITYYTPFGTNGYR